MPSRNCGPWLHHRSHLSRDHVASCGWLGRFSFEFGTMTMPAEFKSTEPTRPGFFKRLVRRVFSLWCLKRLAFGVVALVSLIALVLAVENWRGRRALER